MSFPLSIVGEFDIHRQGFDGDVREQVVAAAADILKKRRFDVEAGDRLISAAPDWHESSVMGSWHPMFLLGDISIAVEGREACAVVRYSISTRLLLGYVTVAMVGVAIVFFSAGSWTIPGHDLVFTVIKRLAGAVLVAGLGWWWLFGMNFLVASWRAPSWLRRLIEEQVGASAA